MKDPGALYGIVPEPIKNLATEYLDRYYHLQRAQRNEAIAKEDKERPKRLMMGAYDSADAADSSSSGKAQGQENQAHITKTRHERKEGKNLRRLQEECEEGQRILDQKFAEYCKRKNIDPEDVSAYLSDSGSTDSNSPDLRQRIRLFARRVDIEHEMWDEVEATRHEEFMARLDRKIKRKKKLLTLGLAGPLRL
ncbi:MAG: hypothetical protein Q9202_000431 [Teloschistes flavicans]